MYVSGKMMIMYTWELRLITKAHLKKSKQIFQCRKVMFAHIEQTNILRLLTDIVLELFETCVVPVLLYSAQIWGWENRNDIKILSAKWRPFCRGGDELTMWEFPP